MGTFSFFAFFFGVMKVRFQGLTLARQVLYHLSHTPEPYFAGFLFFFFSSRPAWIGMLLFMLATVAEMIGHTIVPSYWLQWVLQTFCLAWPPKQSS
jgi:hypothetical protein